MPRTSVRAPARSVAPSDSAAGRSPGMASSMVLTLLLLPVLYRRFHDEPREEIPR